MNIPAPNLEQAIAAIRRGDLPAGQRLLGAILQQEPGNIQAWLWMSAAVHEDERKRFCLEKVLALDPNNAAARQGLAALGRLDKNAAAPRATGNIRTADASRPGISAATAAPAATAPSAPAIPQTEKRPAAVPPAAIPLPPQTAPPAPAPAAAQGASYNRADPMVSPAAAEPARLPPFQAQAAIENLLAGPSPAQQRYWISPKSVFSRLVLLDPMGLVIANPPKEQLQSMQSFLEQGLMPPGLKASRVMPLAVMTEVSANQRDSSASVSYTQQNRLRLASLDFDQQADRNDFFQALRERLGPAFKYSYQEYSRLRALVAPIIWLVILAALTALFYAGAAEAAAGGATDIPGRRTLAKRLGAWLMITLGPTGIAILGGLLILLVIVWGVRRFQNPPRMMVLTRQRDSTIPLALAPLLTGSPKNAPGAPMAGYPAPDTPGAGVHGASGAARPISHAAPLAGSALPPGAPLDAAYPAATVGAPASSALFNLDAAPSAGELPVQPSPAAPPAAPSKPRRPFPWRRVGQFLIITGVVGFVACLAGYYVLNYYLYGAGRNQTGLIMDGSVLNLEGQGLREVSLAEYPPDQITLIDISENKLRELPPEIGQFTNLEYLYLANNQLTSLPPEIGQLKKLKTLVLSGNQLSQLPPEIGQLTNLETLDLQNNKFKGFPSELAKLKKLQHLWVQLNPLDPDATPPEVRKMPAWNR